MSEELKRSIYFLKLILQNNENPTLAALSELYEINNNNKQVILEHLRALDSIVTKAIAELMQLEEENETKY